MAAPTFKSILVCIEFPHDRHQPALKRAAQLAQRTGARLTLFHSAYSQLGAGPRLQGQSFDKDARRLMAAATAALRKLAAPLQQKGLKAGVRTVWDYPAYEAIVRETLRRKPDLVIAGSRRRLLGARLFLTNTDWQLIRLCPVPLLFVKHDRPWGKTRILAAIDPLHQRGKPAQLDRRILQASHALTTATNGRLDVLYAHMPLYSYMPSIHGDAFSQAIDPELEKDYLDNARRALKRTTAAFDVPPEQQHLVPGSPDAVVPALARRLRADVVVMGAVSRSNLARLFIGSTAERTLDQLPCDVLVIKPRGFRTPVPRKVARTAHPLAPF